MLSNYISLNGRTAGPIQIGPSGAWLKMTTPASASGAGTLSFLTSMANSTYCQLQAAAPSKDDEYGVVTVAFLNQYGFNPDNITVDFSQYVTKVAFDSLSSSILGSALSYPSDKNPIVARIDILEREVSNFNSSTDDLEKEISQISSLVGYNSSAIAAVNTRIDNLTLDPFEGAVLFVAGGARTD
jgi:hypothetical protein